MDERVAELVLRAVEQVPRGRVVSYGDLGELVGIGARQVGAIMGRYGGEVAWWRVTNHAGRLPEHLLDEARAHWADEGIGWNPDGHGCRIRQHRADLARLAEAWERATVDVRTPREVD